MEQLHVLPNVSYLAKIRNTDREVNNNATGEREHHGGGHHEAGAEHKAEGHKEEGHKEEAGAEKKVEAAAHH
jgi:hypothetical protein